MVQHAARGWTVQVPDAEHWRHEIRCQSGCPVHTDARAYIRAIDEGDYEEAYRVARGPNPMASICGRVCGAPCEVQCRRGARDAPLSIRALKRFAQEQALAIRGKLPTGHDLLGGPNRTGAWTDLTRLKALREAAEAAPAPGSKHGASVGIIGAGPAGMSAAHDLALLGYKPVVYEMEKLPGGMLRVGIPAYRLPHDLIEAEVRAIESLGVEIRYGVRIGEDVTFAELQERHEAVLISVGLKQSRRLPLPGVDLKGVEGGIEFLREASLGEPVKLGARVVVIGGGNVAYDVARTALRVQSSVTSDIAHELQRFFHVEKVTVACLESREEMPADDVEVYEGAEEGVELLNRLGPKAIIGGPDGEVVGVQFMRCLRVFDESGRFSPRFDEYDTILVDADTVLLSVGQQGDLSFLDGTDVPRDARGRLKVDQEDFRCGVPGLFAAGDIATGPGLAIGAIATGKRCALSIHRYLSGRGVQIERRDRFRSLPMYGRPIGFEKIPRQQIPATDAETRRKELSRPVEIVLPEDLAKLEARRCLRCSISTIFDSDRCIACAGCVDVCPEHCLRLVSLESILGAPGVLEVAEARYGDEGPPDAWEGAAIVKDDAICTRCGLCALRCPTQAITMEELVRDDALVCSTGGLSPGALP